jgi:uncharacterized membrane protein YoaK (UPF0700 family)
LHTGFVTGTLVKFAEQFAKFLTWVFDQVRDPRSSFLSALRHAPQQRPFQVSFWLAAIWLLYVIGAACGMLGDANFNLTALAAPILCLVLLIFIDISRPLALQDEKDQLT